MELQQIYDKLEKIDNEVVDIKVAMAALPHVFVPREEMQEVKREAVLARRWAVGLFLPTFMAIIGILVSVL